MSPATVPGSRSRWNSRNNGFALHRYFSRSMDDAISVLLDSTLAYNFPKNNQNQRRIGIWPTNPYLRRSRANSFQPVRLRYRVLDGKGLLQAFEKLRCVDHDPARQRWV